MLTIYSKLSDEEIIKRILHGEKSFYETIVRRYNPVLYKVGRAYNYNHEDSQDLMQDTFIDAYKNLKQFEGRANFKTWMIQIMLNNCYRKKQKLSYKNEFSKDQNETDEPMFNHSKYDSNKTLQNLELGYIIESAISKLTEEYRMVFSLREINGLSVAETAALLNISEANVKVRLNRAKTMLRNEIEKSYTAADLFEFNAVYCDAMTEKVMAKISALSINEAQ